MFEPLATSPGGLGVDEGRGDEEDVGPWSPPCPDIRDHEDIDERSGSRWPVDTGVVCSEFDSASAHSCNLSCSFSSLSASSSSGLVG